MEDIKVVGIDWHSLAISKLPLTDVVLRAAVIFIIMQIGMRLLGRKNMSHASSYNTVTLFLMGAFSGRAVLGEDTSMTSCVLGLLVVLMLNGAMTWGIYHSPKFAILMEGPVVQQLVRDGIVLTHALHEARYSEEAMMSQLRARGINDIDMIKDAFLERSGQITFLMR